MGIERRRGRQHPDIVNIRPRLNDAPGHTAIDPLRLSRRGAEIT